MDPKERNAENKKALVRHNASVKENEKMGNHTTGKPYAPRPRSWVCLCAAATRSPWTSARNAADPDRHTEAGLLSRRAPPYLS